MFVGYKVLGLGLTLQGTGFRCSGFRCSGFRPCTVLLAQELRGPQAVMHAHNPSATPIFPPSFTVRLPDGIRATPLSQVVRLRTQETRVQGALGAQRTGTRRMPLQLQTNIPHLPRGNMGRGEISLSTTDDLKPKTEGGSWMGSGK